MSKFIRTLTIRFDTEVSQKEIPLFRGAVLRALGDRANLLYHNHTGEDTFRYSYPLIQYKRIGGKAAIVCVEEGADFIQDFVVTGETAFRLGDRIAIMRIESADSKDIEIYCSNNSFKYRLRNWLPLNSKNYQTFQQETSLLIRLQILEKILVSNILSMLKGVDIFLEEWKSRAHLTPEGKRR